jgi:[ribosomal protein S5]-alanine N-acetyltransferase
VTQNASPHFPTLRTARLVLTLPSAETAPALAQYYERNLAHFAQSSPMLPKAAYDVAGCAQRLNTARSDFVAGSSARFVLFQHGRELEPIGDVSLTNIVRGPLQAAYLGYKLDGAYLRQGYMTEAVRAVAAYAFDTLRLHRLMANYIPSNEASARLLQRVGFVVEGHAKDYLHLNGAWRDHVLTSLTNPAPIEPT